MPRYSTVTGKRYGPYHTSVNIRRGTADKLLIPALALRRKALGNERYSQGAFLDEAIHFFVEHVYPDTWFDYERERERGEPQTAGVGSNGREERSA